ncbi:MAG: PfkB family carbohydrate kinase [Patescibacteria group bacterium]
MSSIWKEKIKSPTELAVIIQNKKSQGKKVAQCHGVFDLLHRGHLHQFEQVKSKADILVVTLTADQFVLKGPGRPVFNQNIRADMLAALELVDFVTIVESVNAIGIIKLLQPNYYVKGQSYQEAYKDITGKIGPEVEAIGAVGGEIIFTNEMPIRSTPLLNSYIDPYPEDVLLYLDLFKKKYSFASLLDMVNQFKNLKILLIGETIIDQYDYVEAMDISSKGGIMATRHLSSESFVGGILACANHMATFCSTVDVISAIGTRNSYEGFIFRSLAENVKPWFLNKEGTDTLVKRRQVENNYFTKQSETYYGDESCLKEEEEKKLLARLNSVMNCYDLIFIVDYGHGLLTPRIVDFISTPSHNPKLAVNAQVNSANRGFHLITRYPLADFVSLTQFEARIAFSDKKSSPQDLAEKLLKKLGASAVALTLGRKGSVLSDRSSFCSTPGFSKQVVDTVGAGDAFFSLAALSYVSGFSIEFTGFVGNLAGALSTTYIGNKSSVTKSMFLNFAQTILS